MQKELNNDLIRKDEDEEKILELLYKGLPEIYQPNFVYPVQKLNLLDQTLTGHGIFEEDYNYYASTAGFLESTNRLHYITPINQNYIPTIGNVIIGRIAKVEVGKWLLNIGGISYAQLTPHTIMLDSGEQRRKTDEEIADLQRFFSISDVIFSEVQKVYQNGTCILQNRSNIFGKLANGCLVIIAPYLIKPLTDAIVLISQTVQIIFGSNGYIWVSTPFKSDVYDNNTTKSQDVDRFEEVTPSKIYSIARTRNCILLLAKLHICIDPRFLEKIYEASLLLEIPVPQILDNINIVKIFHKAIKLE